MDFVLTLFPVVLVVLLAFMPLGIIIFMCKKEKL
jgi:hypothetical protein